MENRMKLWDLIVWNQRFKWKVIKYFMSSKNFIFVFCIYEMHLISADQYKDANAEFLTIKATSEISVSMKDVGSGIGIKNLSNLVLKEIYGICETKILQKNKLMNIKWQKEKLNAYNNTNGDNQDSIASYKKYFLPRVKIEYYNIKIDGKNFDDQPINDSIKQYVIIYYILEQSKETKLEFTKRATKVL